MRALYLQHLRLCPHALTHRARHGRPHLRTLVQSEASLLEAVQDLATAERQGDVAAIAQLLAVDYLGHDPAGRSQDRASVLRAYAEGGARLATVQLSELQARMVGEIGLVTGVSSIQGRQGTEPVHLRLRFLEVYAWREERWQLVAAQNTRLPW